ncbi:hypothetical protein MCELHM10_01316 [Paracoccaceae bacterium]
MSFLVGNRSAVSIMKIRCRIVAYAVASIVLGSSVAYSDVSVKNAEWIQGSAAGLSVDQLPHVEVEGAIVPGMEIDFKAAIERVLEISPMKTMGGTRTPIVVLNSPGGDVLTAIRMGEIARATAAQTYVMPGYDCSSACVLVFAAGVDRFLAEGGRLGLHRPAFTDFESFARLEQENAINTYLDLLTFVENYLSTMRINPEFSRLLLETKSTDITFIDQEEALSFGIMGTDPAFQEWDMARFRTSVSGEDFRAWTDYLNCVDACPTLECQDQCALQ